MDCFDSPFGKYQLQRLPLRPKETLRACDAADELLLKQLAENGKPSVSDNILILNDSFGALACNLHHNQTSSWGDSYLAHKATEHNFNFNQLEPTPKNITSTETPDESYSLVLVKIPKTLALLEHQLIGLKSCITEDTQVIAAGMVKYLHKSHYKLFEESNCTYVM